MRHRDDIDGLRAIAVLPILLFHAGVASMSGGFVGVDIFFVISGFLITNILGRDIAAGQFSIARFYRRRVVRIFPALVALLLVVLAAGSQVLLVNELRGLSESAAAAMGFVSNIYFWKDADYFAGAAEAKPLLHTWSLGVEEQFYIFYPLLLVLLRRWVPHRIGLVILAITLLSFALSIVVTIRAPSTAFYLLPTRAWELGAGALVALGITPKLASPRRRDLAAVTGLILVIAAVFTIEPGTLFPAPAAALPCVGAMLLIAYGEGAITQRLLAAPPVRWVGAISYSLYLWHWPLITFYRLRYGFTLTPSATLILVAASFAAAALSYYWIEQPFLRRFRDGGSRRVIGVGGLALASVVGGALVISTSASAIVRYPPAVRTIADYSNYRDMPQYDYQFRKGPCFVGAEQTFDVRRCLAMAKDRPNAVVLGDSHAAQYWRAITLRFPEANVMQATASGCRPTIALHGERRCTAVVDLVLNTLSDRPELDAVILAGRWQPDEVDPLAATVRMLRAKRLAVIVIGPTIEYDGEMPQLLARAMLQNDTDALASLRLRERERLDRRMKSRIEQAGGLYVSEVDGECPAGKCQLLDRNGGPFHFDYGHLTLAAAQQIVGRMPSILTPRH